MTNFLSHPLHSLHERAWENNRFIYPVLSRRSGGISIGVNLNPDRICNFDCIYCQVDRSSTSETRFVEMKQLLEELDHMLRLVSTGHLYEHQKFQTTPESLRRLNDIAFSGDGEPTTYKNFDAIIQQCAELKRAHQLDEVKMVLITNASMFHRPAAQRGLEILDQNQGEVWAKLDAGTEDYYQLVERTKIPFSQVLNNLLLAAQKRPIVIQALFMRIHGDAPSSMEQAAFCNRLNEITQQGGRISLVQLYTIARKPAESFVQPLDDYEVDAFAKFVEEQTQLPVAKFYGRSVD